MSTTTSTITIIAANIAVVFGALGIQTFWINKRLELIERRLDHIEGYMMNFAERISRLEGHRHDH